MKRIAFSLLGLLFIASLLLGCATEKYALHDPLERFKIATTTSLYDTGLWYYLEPIFETKANLEMDIVYAGTGIALEYGKRGDVDAWSAG